MAFLDPNKPIATCREESCVDCPVDGLVICHFRPHQLFHFFLIWLPGFIIGGAGILRFGVWPFVGWLVIIIGFFATLKMFLCSQCMNLACPLNGVKEEARELFFARNPVVPRAWGRDPDA